ncbi:hypothetical protein ACNFCK_17205 [Pseudomonas sp. NY15366]
MFDDYDYKDTSARVRVKFTQLRDEPMYPWEIAKFLKNFNTVYYKFELLNSISSAINHGISPEDIFIFDHSLPLYERYSELDLISGGVAAKLFYPIGMPIPLVPSVKVYEFNCLYRIFNTINSFLTNHRIGRLSLLKLSALYEDLEAFGLQAAEGELVKYAYEQAQKSYEAAARRKEKKRQFSDAEFNRALEKYEKYKSQLFLDVEYLNGLDDQQRIDVLTLEGRDNLRLSRLLTSFFVTFEKTVRPLVCARVGDNQFRVLGRSLVNKNALVGLELKEVRRNSPLGALFEGGVAVYQAIQQERRAKEVHEIDMQIKAKELELLDAQIHGQKVQNLEHELRLAAQMDSLARQTDISALKEMNDSFVKSRLTLAYGMQHSNASDVLHNHGLRLEHESVALLDVQV